MSQARPTLGKHATDFVWLLRSELFILREAWFWYLLQASFVPLAYMVFMWLLLGREQARVMEFAVTGSLVMTFSFAGMLSLGQHLGWLKAQHAFEHYATLPISKTVFILAVTTRGTLLTLPSALTILLVGQLLFGISIPIAGFGVLLLAGYSLAGFGAFIGFWSPTAQVASLATQILQTVIIFFAPVYFPAEALPDPLRWSAAAWPTTYAAETLRAIASGATLLEVLPGLLALFGFAAVFTILAPTRLSWRASS